MKTRRITTAAAVMAALLASCASEPTVDQSAPASSPQARAAESSTAPQVAPAAQQALRPAVITAAELSKRSVYYDFDRYDVKDEYRALVQANARYLREHPR